MRAGNGKDLTNPSTVPAIVQAPVASIVVATPAIALVPGGTAQIEVSAEDASGNALAGETITWNTSNAPVATVSATGVVTAVAIGTATITASSEGVSGAATVTVTATTAPVAALAITPDSVGIGTGSVSGSSDHQLQLRAIATDSSGNLVSGQTVVWSSSDAAIATVSSTGLMTGSADVTTSSPVTITATCAGKVAAALFWVNPPVAAVVVTPPAATLSIGGTIQLTASVQDASGHTLNGVPLTWGSANAKIARQSKGLVTALAAGTATINAVTPGGVEGEAAITVTSGVAHIREAASAQLRRLAKYHE